MTTAVDGHCDASFAPRRQALSDTVASATEVGAALAVYVDKQCVVDLWAGHADAARTRPWARDTLVNLFSVGKAISALCVSPPGREPAGSIWTRPSRATGPSRAGGEGPGSPCATS